MELNVFIRLSAYFDLMRISCDVMSSVLLEAVNMFYLELDFASIGDISLYREFFLKFDCFCDAGASPDGELSPQVRVCHYYRFYESYLPAIVRDRLRFFMDDELPF